MIRPVPRSPGGALRGRHERGARDAVDVSGRGARAQTNDPDADAKARGPGLPTLRPSSREDDLAGDGSNKARFPGRARHKR